MLPFVEVTIPSIVSKPLALINPSISRKSAEVTSFLPFMPNVGAEMWMDLETIIRYHEPSELSIIDYYPFFNKVRRKIHSSSIAQQSHY